MAATRTLITADELERMSFPDERVELSEGELIRMPPAGAEHAHVIIALIKILAPFVDSNGLGEVGGPDVGFRLSAHTVLSPDVSFVSRGRIPPSGIPRGFWPFAPDLAIEVFSPSDTRSDLHRKIRLYLEARTLRVWVLFPRKRQIHVHQGPARVIVLKEEDVLTGEDVLPGFSVPVKRIFL